MHPSLADWYRVAGIEPTSEMLAKRWQGLEAFVPGKKGIAEMARRFFNLGRFDETSLAELSNSLKQADTLFPMHGNDQELRVLCGVKLATIIEGSPTELSVASALAVACGAAQNLREAPCIPDIPEIAAKQLRRLSIDRVSNFIATVSVAPESPISQELSKLGVPYDKIGTEFSRLQTQIAVLSEETNMLWWLFSEHSREAPKRWREIGFKATTLIAGKELADLTQVLPGPTAAAAFLDRAIRSAKAKPPSTIEIVQTVNALSADWRRAYTSSAWSQDLDVLMPISVAIKSCVSSPENNQWVPAFSTITGLPAGSKLVPKLLSFQIYLECLLRRAFIELDKL